MAASASRAAASGMRSTSRPRSDARPPSWASPGGPYRQSPPSRLLSGGGGRHGRRPWAEGEEGQGGAGLRRQRGRASSCDRPLVLHGQPEPAHRPPRQPSACSRLSYERSARWKRSLGSGESRTKPATSHLWQHRAHPCCGWSSTPPAIARARPRHSAKRRAATAAGRAGKRCGDVGGRNPGPEPATLAFRSPAA